MRKILLFLILVSSADLSVAADKDFKVFWKDGLRMETEDKEVQLRLGGRLHLDWAFFELDDSLQQLVGEMEDAVEVRRARFYFSGKLYQNLEFKIQYDFAGGEAEARDVYLGFSGIPYLGTFRAGHFKEPYSLEELTSSNNITLMERSLANTFAPSRNMGLMLANSMAGDRATWAAGLFKETDDLGFGSGDDNYSFTGRITALPWYEEAGRRLFHLGFAYSHRKPSDNTVRFQARPEAHLSKRFIDTGSFAARSLDLFGPEAAFVLDSFSLQGEYQRSQIDRRSQSDVSFEGGYLQASYVLTGESRSYRPAEGAFASVKPTRNFTGRGGPGAWEVALRYSRLGLNEGAIMGGVLEDWTLGLNWYLNPHTRVMSNYVRAEREDTGASNIFQMRFQVNF